MVESILNTLAPFVMLVSTLAATWSVKMALDPLRRNVRVGNWFSAAGNITAVVMIASTIFIK